MFLKLQKVLVSASRTHIHKNVAFFAKEAPKKDGKKDDKAAPVAVIEEVPLSTLATQLIAPNHPSLSPSELNYYNQGFADLSESDKQLLNDFAERLLAQPTAIFYDAVLKKGALGTSELYFTAVDELADEQISQKVRAIRKQL